MTAVLLTCVGQRVDIVSAFGRAGAATVATDVNPLAPALYHADRFELVPRVESADYIAVLADLVRSHDVGLVVPLTDLGQLALARAEEELGALVLLPAPGVVERVSDKYLTHLFLEERGIPSPPTWRPHELPADPDFPLLVKARHGFGSRHIYRARTRAELDFFLAYTPVEPIVQGCCRGAEYSIDVFCDRDGTCLNAIPRTMIESKGGESIKGMTVKDWDLIDFGRYVAETLELVGSATIQCFREDDGRHEVTDVNPRFGGAFPLPLAAGSRYPELALALAAGEHPQPRLGDFRAGVVMTRFYSHLCLTAGADGTLEPFAEELPEPIASEPGDA